MYWHDHFMGFPFFWWLVPFIVIVIIVLLVRKPQSTNYHRDISRETPLEILKKRYAKGEISKEEYLEAKKTLEE